MSNKLNLAEQVHHNHKNDIFFRKLVKIVIFRVRFLCSASEKDFPVKKLAKFNSQPLNGNNGGHSPGKRFLLTINFLR